MVEDLEKWYPQRMVASWLMRTNQDSGAYQLMTVGRVERVSQGLIQ